MTKKQYLKRIMRMKATMKKWRIPQSALAGASGLSTRTVSELMNPDSFKRRANESTIKLMEIFVKKLMADA